MVGALLGIGIFLVIVGLLVASFFVRRHGEVDKPEVGWQRTDEVFNDPSTNRVMRVWLDEEGERRYVPEKARRAT